MANTTILDLPVAVSLSGQEQIPLESTNSSATAVTKRATSAQIAGLAANIPTVALNPISVFGNPTTGTTIGTSIVGTAGKVLLVNDGGTAVLFGQLNLSNTASVTGSISTASFTGVLDVPHGGLGTSTLATGGILYGNGTSAVQVTNSTANAVLVTNASATPSFTTTLPQAVQLKITSVGTIATGVWNGTIVTVPFGGTGTSALTANSVLLGNGTAAISAVANATSGYILTSTGPGTAPTFQASAAGGTASLPGLSVFGVTGTATATGSAITGTTDQVLRVSPSGTALVFGSVNLSTSAAVTGYLNFANITSIAALSVAANSSSAATTMTAVSGTTDQVLRVASSGTSLGFGQINLSTSAAVTGSLPFASMTSLAALSVLGNTSSAQTTMAGIAGTADQVLRVSTSGTALIFGRVNLGTTAAVTGTLGLLNGGTNATTAAGAVTSIGALSNSATGQVMTAGFIPVAFNLGTTAGNTFTIVPGNGPLQRLVSVSTFSFVAPSNDGEVDIFVKNNTSASTITISGFGTPGSTGDAYATTVGAGFIFMSRTINGSSTYAWKSYQTILLWFGASSIAARCAECLGTFVT